MATGKNEKEYSWHVPAIKFIGMKQLVSNVANILEKLRNLWKWEIWGNIVKIWYFVNNFLIEARIQKFFCTCVTHIIVIIWSTAHYVSTWPIFSYIGLQISLPNFSFFTAKLPSVTQRSVSRENAYKKS